jgi:thiol-disulfide isomerase/thioredoxin
MPGVVVLSVALLVALVAAVWMQRSGRRLGQEPETQGTATEAASIAPEDLGHALGERATLVQFSTAFCQPCRATRRVLSDVAGQVAGVSHVEIDAESHLDLVRRLEIWRTPTVFVLDRSGRIIRRASGQPRPVDVIAAVGAAVEL